MSYVIGHTSYAQEARCLLASGCLLSGWNGAHVAGRGTPGRHNVASLPFSASPFQSAFRQRASLERGSRRMSETENGFTLGSMVGQRHPARLGSYISVCNGMYGVRQSSPSGGGEPAVRLVVGLSASADTKS